MVPTTPLHYFIFTQEDVEDVLGLAVRKRTNNYEMDGLVNNQAEANSHEEDIEEVEAIVPLADAGTQPRTVMV
jgi:hypothetical protein